MKTSLLAAVLLPITALARPWTPPSDPIAPLPPPAESFRAGPPSPGVLAPPMARPDMDPRRTRDDDARDLWSVDTTLAQLDRAAASRDIRLLRSVDGRARWLLSDELRESEREVERARFEAGRGNPRRVRQAESKLARIVQLDRGYRVLARRLDPWSVGQRRAILVDLDRLNRRELAGR